jgi:iron complex transport system ATP-binding protein
MAAILAADRVSAGFGDRTVIHGLSLSVAQGEILSIIGPNGSGKSTLLKILSRNVKPQKGSVLLDGRDINRFSAKELARRLAILHQAPYVSGDLTVRDLVAYGRFPYQNWWQGGAAEDKKVVERVLDQTGLLLLASRQVNTLSGGERQRAWIAMALAQKPRILLLDEPTTHLDICYQLEIMDLVAKLNQEQQITIIMVLHDINHAARYSDTVAVLSQGELYAAGHPVAVTTPAMFREVFSVEADIWPDDSGRPVCLVKRRAAVVSDIDRERMGMKP